MKDKKVIRKWAFKTLVFSFCALSCGLPGFTADNDEGVKKFGVVFDIAKDRKVENVGGLYQPEGLDKYIKRLTDDLTVKMSALEEANKRNEQKLDEVLALLKDQKAEKNSAQKNPPAAKVRNIFQ